MERLRDSTLKLSVILKLLPILVLNIWGSVGIAASRFCFKDKKLAEWPSNPVGLEDKAVGPSSTSTTPWGGGTKTTLTNTGAKTGLSITGWLPSGTFPFHFHQYFNDRSGNFPSMQRQIIKEIFCVFFIYCNLLISGWFDKVYINYESKSKQENHGKYMKYGW